MTQPTPEHPAVVPVTPSTGSRLEQLHASYPELKAAADAAASALKDCTDAIKAELVAAAPNQSKVALLSPFGPPLQLTYSQRTSVDSKRLKAERPDLYVVYSKTSGAWSLSPAKGGGQ